MQTKVNFSEIIISGMSGRFPQSDNLDEFWENLVNGKDMVSDNHSRYNSKGMNLPSRIGALKNIDKFDAEFFSIHGKQSAALDPRMKKLYEVTYETVVDAGINMVSLQGTSTGVFVAMSGSDGGAIWSRSELKTNAYVILGNAPSMLANRLSFTFDLRGPSYIVDSACASASLVVQIALHSIRTGLCDSAIAAGVQLLFDPVTCVMFRSLDMTSPQGKCCAFDDSVDGYVRSEAVVGIYICKRQSAKRCYATLVHAKVNCDGFKEQGITYPSRSSQEKLIRAVYEEAGVDLLDVDYVEAHGTGTRAGDTQEGLALTDVFTVGRERPLLIGSFKSNMGHPEPVAGLCAIVKILLSYINGIIPANLNYSKPNSDIPALHDGRLQVVDRNQSFNPNYVSINSLGFGGVNVHIIIKFDNQPLWSKPWSPKIPIILFGSGRTKNSVEYYLVKALKHQDSQHFVKLLHELSRDNVPKHPFRGFVVTESETYTEKNELIRSVWFILTGLGSQWSGMSKDLMRIDVFKQSIEKSSEILLQKGFDLMSLLESSDNDLFDIFRNGFISIPAYQVALLDVLKHIGIEPNGIIGHSNGEVASGYADGCLTHEQTVLIPVAREQSLSQSGLPAGTIVSVGLTWEEAHQRCPEGVFPAIHTAKENVIIAGPPEKINTFVEQLEEQNVFVKSIRSAAFGFHSPLVQGSGPMSKKLLSEIITEPKIRSKKWLSTSIPAHLWDSNPICKYCSADYYVNMESSPVYFYPTLLQLPHNVVAIEVAPHCFMQSILKQTLSNDAVIVGLIHVKAPDNCLYFLKALGKCFLAGINFNIGSLYEPVKFPVSSKTPYVSSMIRWDHSQTWLVPHNSQELSNQKGKKFTISLQSENFLSGHVINNKIVFPATGYVFLVWRYFAEEQNLKVEDCPVVLQNLRFDKMIYLKDNVETTFVISVFEGSHKFEILESDNVVCSGEIQNVEGYSSDEMICSEDSGDYDEEAMTITREAFYKDLNIRGYGHARDFQNILKLDLKTNCAKVQWSGHWISFLDSLLQTQLLRLGACTLVIPTRIKNITINPMKTKSHLQKHSNTVGVKGSEMYDAVSCPGVELRGFIYSVLPERNVETKPITSIPVFLPYVSHVILTLSEPNILASCVEIVLDNSYGKSFVFTEILDDLENIISDMIIQQTLLSFPTTDFRTIHDISTYADEERLSISGSKLICRDEISSKESSNFVYIDNAESIKLAESLVLDEGFILFKGKVDPDIHELELTRIAERRFCKNQRFVLFRKQSRKPKNIHLITIDDPTFEWVKSANYFIQHLHENEIIAFKSQNSISGILGFIKCLVKEMTPKHIRCYYTIDPFELDFEFPSKILQDQIEKDLLFNIYQCSFWGHFANVFDPLDDLQGRRISAYAYVNTLKVGDLSSLNWINSPLKHSQKDLAVVHYSALNFRDVMLATGSLNQILSNSADCSLGLEFAGTQSGRRIFASSISHCLATYVDLNGTSFVMPNYWTYEEAATVFTVYSTVYVALIIRGRMKSGESILIHAGSGGVGQAAIAVALSMNCHVITTVSSSKKLTYLKSRYPALTDNNFASSRNAMDFQRHVLKHTNGKGTKLILNSLAGKKLVASIECLSRNGRFLEIGKIDMVNDTKIGLNLLLKGASLYGIDSQKVIYDPDLEEEHASFFHYVLNGISLGVVQPLATTVFRSDEVEDAFRFMSQGKHIGKVLVQIRVEDLITKPICAYARTYFDSTKSYIIIGGLGGMGFELANWMIQRGANRFVLVSRFGSLSSYHEYRIQIWKNLKVRVVICKDEISSSKGVRSILNQAKQLGPIGGIFNSAVVLHDAIFENQTSNSFKESVKAKSVATAFFDQISREVAPDLDYFVVFSSVVALLGNSGQTNYGYASSAMERICEQRSNDGLPALAIQWGAVGDVGVIHRQFGNVETFAGLKTQNIQSCLKTLDLFLQQTKPVVSSYILPSYARSSSVEMKDSLVDYVASILGIKDVSTVNPKTSLVDLGMDSLMISQLSDFLECRKNIRNKVKSPGQLTFEMLAELEINNGSPETLPVHNVNVEDHFRLVVSRNRSDKPVFKMKSLCRSTDIVFMVHPVDGTMVRLETLATNLEAIVYGIECVNTAPLESIEALAAFYLEEIQTIQPHGAYKICGYSFGASVAFEMALQLERRNEALSVLLLLDGSPRWKHLIESCEGIVGIRDWGKWENVFLTAFLQNSIPNFISSMSDKLEQIITLQEKCDYLVSLLSRAYPDIREEITSLIASIMARMEGVNVYEAKGKVKSRTVLIKAKQVGWTGDIGLTDICDKTVEVIEVDGNHDCFFDRPLELGIPEIINRIFQ